MQPAISVIFVTHNRKDLLRRALRSVILQTVPVDIIIMDDASEDGTGDMIKQEFPFVHYYLSSISKGPSYQRNEGAKHSRSEIIIFLDDDTVLQSNDTIETTIHDFDSPSIGAVAMPFINILQDKKVKMYPPDNSRAYLVHAFIAAAFAIRNKCFQSVVGFREDFFYMGEEGDLCIRMLDAGYYVKLGTATPAHHYQLAGRVSFAADFYGRRNDIYFLYLNAPRSLLFFNLAATILKGIWFGIRVGRIRNMLKGMKAGLKLSFFDHKDFMIMPVKKTVYQRYRYLKKHEPLEKSKLIYN
ncbi:MAG TPA: glycosyltransferase [Flavisolibacter sp.]|nr:glycosyltransferase [Flavisolibacter sp.]